MFHFGYFLKYSANKNKFPHEYLDEQPHLVKLLFPFYISIEVSLTQVRVRLDFFILATNYPLGTLLSY